MIIDIDMDDGVTDATHSRLVREALRETMRVYLRGQGKGPTFMKDHFTENAKTAPGGAYGYRARSAEYNARKRKQVGHTRPNYFFGLLARQCRNAQITATQKRARTIIRAPQERKKKKSQHGLMSKQQRLELEAMTPQEEQEIADWVGQLYQTEASKPKNRRRRKRKIQA